MLKKNKAISQTCLSLILLFMLLAGFASCKNPSSPSPLSSEDETFTVKFDTKGGTPVPDPLIVPAGSKIKAPEGIKKSYYSLWGWYREPEFKQLWDFKNDIVTSDMTLYARWGIGGSSSASGDMGSDSSGGYTSPTGTSAYSQIVHYYQQADMDGDIGLIDISFTHKGSSGPDPREGDSYVITLKEGTGTDELSRGTIQIVDGHIIFIPSDGDHPFMGDLKEGVLRNS